VTFAEYAEAWSRLHGGYSPSVAVRGWIRLAYAGGRRLAALGAGPAVVTSAGLVLSLAVPFVVRAPAGLLIAGLLVIASAVADTFDGAVAIITGKITKTGFVYDSAADRIAEAAWLTGFWLAGAPGWLAVGCGAFSWLHEYVRARATAAGMTGLGTVTVAERPTRVALAACGFVLAGTLTGSVVLIFLGLWLLLAVVGLLQLSVAVHQALR
jgi:phosphatidylglycerophosphate synthase